MLGMLEILVMLGMLGMLERRGMLGMLGDAEDAWNAGMSGGGVHWAEVDALSQKNMIV